jgi:hypothetical protein
VLTDVMVRMRAQGHEPEKAAELLTNAGPPILASLRKFLHLLNTERRIQERVPYPVPVQVFELLRTGELSPPIVAQGKDITTLGMGLYLPYRPKSNTVYLQITPVRHAPVAIPAYVVQVRPCPDGRFEVGTSFAWDRV